MFLSFQDNCYRRKHKNLCFESRFREHLSLHALGYKTGKLFLTTSIKNPFYQFSLVKIWFNLKQIIRYKKHFYSNPLMQSIVLCCLLFFLQLLPKVPDYFFNNIQPFRKSSYFVLFFYHNLCSNFFIVAIICTLI